MTEKLTWDEIKNRYPDEWVELVDYDWPEGEPYPASGAVHAHAPTRKELTRLALVPPVPMDAARVYVGEPKKDKNTIISCNSVRITYANS